MRKLNSFLRKLFAVCGGAFILYELIPDDLKKTEKKEDFDGEEFDDIW